MNTHSLPSMVWCDVKQLPRISQDLCFLWGLDAIEETDYWNGVC